jgi:hypothetical protein
LVLRGIEATNDFMTVVVGLSHSSSTSVIIIRYAIVLSARRILWTVQMLTLGKLLDSSMMPAGYLHASRRSWGVNRSAPIFSWSPFQGIRIYAEDLKYVTWRIDATTNLSDQVAVVMSLAGDPPVTFPSSDMP